MGLKEAPVGAAGAGVGPGRSGRPPTAGISAAHPLVIDIDAPSSTSTPRRRVRPRFSRRGLATTQGVGPAPMQ